MSAQPEPRCRLCGHPPFSPCEGSYDKMLADHHGPVFKGVCALCWLGYDREDALVVLVGAEDDPVTQAREAAERYAEALERFGLPGQGDAVRRDVTRRIQELGAAP